jgi:hypothetical protein
MLLGAPPSQDLIRPKSSKLSYSETFLDFG